MGHYWPSGAVLYRALLIVWSAARRGMSELVWGQQLHYWFGPNTNRPVPTVRLSGKSNLAALLQACVSVRRHNTRQP
jgi:hypothetical protein